MPSALTNSQLDFDQKRRRRFERLLIFLLASIQFVNILDFIIVAPLGPDFSGALSISSNQMGSITSSYSFAAALAGILGFFVLNHFPRRPALIVALLGLAFGTLMCGFSQGLWSLLAARAMAGFFGGPASALAFAILADEIPPNRRGKAMGLMMGSVSAAQIFGVPISLTLATMYDWRVPFFVVSGLGGVIAVGVSIMFSRLTRSFTQGQLFATPSLFRLLQNRSVCLSYLMTFVIMMAGFMLLPHLSTYVQKNLHYLRQDVPWLFFCMGVASLFAFQAGGYVVDKIGSFKVGLFASLLFIGNIYFLLIAKPMWLPLIIIYISFGIGLSLRNVAYNTLTSKVPTRQERAPFLSIQSMIQHLATSIGGFLSSAILVERQGELWGMQTVAFISIGLTAFVPVLMRVVETSVMNQRLEAKI